MGDVVRPPNIARRLPPRKRLAVLMWRELRLAAHLHAPRLRPLAGLAGAGQDELTFEFSEAAEHRQQQAAVRCRRVRPGIAEGAESGLRLRCSSRTL